MSFHDPTCASVGVFDSGIGGFSVLRELRRLAPAESVVYLADQAHVPYGLRPLGEVRALAEAVTRFLLCRRAKLVVVACNTASAAALHELRRLFPETPFVGMEPAVKPAAAITCSGTLGVIATPATFQGELYASVVRRFADGRRVLQHSCPGLVAEIERGHLDGARTRRILEAALRPMLAAGMDTVVLGCTHYPFVLPLIREIVGPDVAVIDPAPAVARQAVRVLEQRGLRNQQTTPGRLRVFTTGRLAESAKELLGEDFKTESAAWRNGKLIARRGAAAQRI